MAKLFKPTSWGSDKDVIKFKTAATFAGASNAASGAGTSTKKKSKKKQNRNKQKKNKDSSGAVNVKNAEKPTTPKVKSGRIEKKKNNAKNQKQQQQRQKIKLSPSLAKAAIEAMDTTPAPSNNSAAAAAAASVPTTLEAKLKEQLIGGRFRYLNEQLYTMNSKKAMNLFQQDHEAFEAYHVGYRHQVEKWPFNPLQRIIKTIRRLPKSLEIGDFGCGEGKLAESVPHKVYSMDLVSCRDEIIACDMAATPLQTHSLDVAVYCLSLMGTNLNDYLLEANRVLKMGGLIYIAEIQSRFEDVKQFVRAMDAVGFELKKKDVGVKLFFNFFEFRKVRNVGKVAVLKPFSLKPCLYRKR